ncbi:hypothetical protein P879_11779 [Paragonimus westermani]|uniref:DNA polymerase Y-family little finger domain-containing protein n=1 Tax=Paragonimus westermani TaxID=34504 RepID=A0A8T0DHM5_9TREM|nr:hypothetical protein P879_11779 [Paragonimus westermani]
MKLKLDNFEVRSRSQPLPDYTNDAEIIATFATEILREEMLNEKSAIVTVNHKASTSTRSPGSQSSRVLTLRLMGLRMSTLLPVEMCPQIRQYNIEQAFAQARASNQNEELFIDPMKKLTEESKLPLSVDRNATTIVRKTVSSKKRKKQPSHQTPVSIVYSCQLLVANVGFYVSSSLLSTTVCCAVSIRIVSLISSCNL